MPKAKTPCGTCAKPCYGQHCRGCGWTQARTKARMLTVKPHKSAAELDALVAEGLLPLHVRIASARVKRPQQGKRGRNTAYIFAGRKPKPSVTGQTRSWWIGVPQDGFTGKAQKEITADTTNDQPKDLG